MNIQTVADNLRNTIAGKEAMLNTLNSRRIIDKGAVHYLEINIDELKRILQDLESCVAKEVEQSWRDNPDRSGGAFTDEEINRAGEWR